MGTQATKKTQLHVQRKRKGETLKSSPIIEMEDTDAEEREGLSKLEKMDGFLLNRPRSRGRRSEFYPVQQYVQLNDGTEINVKNSLEREFPIIQDGVTLYAKVKKMTDSNEQFVEVPLMTKDDIPICIHNDTGILYPMDLTKNRPVFKVNEDGSEEYLTDTFITIPHYPIDTNGKAYHARGVNGDEFPIRRDNKCIYDKGKNIYAILQ
ncbi:hypothetical protein AVEN_228052-1 [Araneus ventricosus]|uniref:Uncharacterized protein n=1 Tax=Araneus ventricosus TaxID=182803 RepID=A0A4Y2MBQ2_ARAVE|nr:hypothetical protein AVEN_228052-1 [Araneus ventricosus]